MNDAALRVEIAYAEPQRAIVKRLGTRPGFAGGGRMLRLAALDPDFTGVDLKNSTVLGIFGKLTQGDRVLHDGDRIEIYRPLGEDPKTARRQRAKQARR